MSSTATTTVRARREKTYPRSKNRVGVFDAFSFSRTRSACSETPCSRRKKSSTPTTTASGMRYFGFRFYSPTLGRWLNRDPIEEMGGINTYSFVFNNPLNGHDLLGLQDAACAETLIAEGSWVFGPWVFVGVVGGIAVWEAYDHRDDLYQLWKEVCKLCEKAGTEVKRITRTRRKTGCPPCPPPPPPQYHYVPNQHGCPNGHWHYFVYDQAPDCTCYLRRVFGGCL